MILLSRFILKGTSQAALVAAAMAVLSLVPVLGMFAILLSGASVALISLVQGYRQGTVVMLVALLGAAVFTGLLFAQPLIAVYFLLAVWLPVWLAALVLRETVSLALSLLLVTALSLLALLVMYLLFPEFAQYWQAPLEQQMAQTAELLKWQLTPVEMQAMVANMIRLIPGLIASTLLLGTVLSLLLARWWQAVNFNPGGFAIEFQALRLGRSAALIAILLIVLTGWLQSDMLLAMSLVVFTLYFLLGIAVLHAVVNRKRINPVWLYLVYVLMLFIPQIMVALVVLGLADTWLDFRRRFAA